MNTTLLYPNKTGCVCEKAGYCERHKVNKNEHWYKLCCTRIDYWNAWERGAGLGQFLKPISMPRIRKRESINSHIGDIIASRFEQLGIVPVKGCPCKDLQDKLNKTSPEAVLSDINGWSKKLQRSARKWKELKGGIWNLIPAPPLWLCCRVLEDAVKQSKGLIDSTIVTSIVE